MPIELPSQEPSLPLGDPFAWLTAESEDRWTNDDRTEWLARGIELSEAHHYVDYLLGAESSSGLSNSTGPVFLEVEYSRGLPATGQIEVWLDADLVGVFPLASTGGWSKDAFRRRLRVALPDFDGMHQHLILRVPQSSPTDDPSPTTDNDSLRDSDSVKDPSEPHSFPRLVTGLGQLLVEVGNQSRFYWNQRPLPEILSAASGEPVSRQAGIVTTRFLDAGQAWMGRQQFRVHGATVYRDEVNATVDVVTPPLVQQDDVVESRRVVVTENDVLVVEITVENHGPRAIEYPVNLEGTLQPSVGDEASLPRQTGRRYFVRDRETILGFDTHWKDSQWPLGLCLAIGFSELSTNTELDGDAYRAEFRLPLAAGERQRFVAACSIATSREEAEANLHGALSRDDLFHAVQQRWREQVIAAGPQVSLSDPARSELVQRRREILFARWLARTDGAPEGVTPDSVSRSDVKVPRGIQDPGAYQASLSCLDLVWQDAQLSRQVLHQRISEQRQRIEQIESLSGEPELGGAGVDQLEPSLYAVAVWWHYLIYQDAEFVRHVLPDLAYEARAWTKQLHSSGQSQVTEGPFSWEPFERFPCLLPQARNQSSRAVATVHLIRVLQVLDHLAGVSPGNADRADWAVLRNDLLDDWRDSPALTLDFPITDPENRIRNQAVAPPGSVIDLTVFWARLGNPQHQAWIARCQLGESGRAKHGLPRHLSGNLALTASQRTEVEIPTVQIQRSEIGATLQGIEGLGWYLRAYDRQRLAGLAAVVEGMVQSQLESEICFPKWVAAATGRPWGQAQSSCPSHWNHMVLTELAGLRLLDDGRVQIDPLPLERACDLTLPDFRGRPLHVSWRPAVDQEPPNDADDPDVVSGGPTAWPHRGPSCQLEVHWGDELLIQQRFTPGDRPVDLGPVGWTLRPRR